MKPGGWLITRAALRRGQPLVYSWDKNCGLGISYQGYGMDELLRHLLLKEASGSCRRCNSGDCTHAAARLIVDEVVDAERQIAGE